MREILTIEEVKQKLKWNNSCGWILVEYLYVPIKSILKKKWNDFAKKKDTIDKCTRNNFESCMGVFKCGAYIIELCWLIQPNLLDINDCHPW